MASSKRSAAPAKSSCTTSPEPKATSTSSRTTSTSSPSVVIALGSNLGDRAWHLRRALHELRRVIRIVRSSSVHETAAVDAPLGSPPFLNMVVLGYTSLPPLTLLIALQSIEHHLGRARRRIRNEPRIIDLDLIAYGATRMRTARLTLPHPRAHQRAFVMEPLRELGDVGCRIAGSLVPSATPHPPFGHLLPSAEGRRATNSGSRENPT